MHVGVCASRTEQNEHAWRSGWLHGAGVPGGAAGGEDRGTHHLLQPKGDDADEGKQLVFDWTVCRIRWHLSSNADVFFSVIILIVNSRWSFVLLYIVLWLYWMSVDFLMSICIII